MKLNQSPRIAADAVLQREMREHATQVNALSEGRMAAHYNAATAAPTTGDYAKGDFVRNSDPQELGTAGSKYVIAGWMKLASGFSECRFLTGN
jgi:hypothetical protein